VQLLSGTTQQFAVSGILHQRMLEGVDRIRRRAPAEHEAGDHEPIQRGIQLSRVPLCDGRQQLLERPVF
jgi:hypothetical protein